MSEDLNKKLNMPLDDVSRMNRRGGPNNRRFKGRNRNNNYRFHRRRNFNQNENFQNKRYNQRNNNHFNNRMRNYEVR